MYFLQYTLGPSSLKIIINYWLYLHVLTVLDIVTTDGHDVLLSALEGKRDLIRVSTITWPTQLVAAILHINIQGKMNQALGKWISLPAQ